MQRLVILSDLWGAQRSDWVEHYTSPLRGDMEIIYYDACVLGQIDISDYDENNLHRQFVNGGIDRAIEALLEKEKYALNLLGFSVGGYIGWKAALKGLPVNHLFAVSSTRLRVETQKPPGSIHLYYGECDQHKPAPEWFIQMAIAPHYYQQEPHDFYTRAYIAANISADIRACIG